MTGEGTALPSASRPLGPPVTWPVSLIPQVSATRQLKVCHGSSRSAFLSFQDCCKRPATWPPSGPNFAKGPCFPFYQLSSHYHPFRIKFEILISQNDLSMASREAPLLSSPPAHVEPIRGSLEPFLRELAVGCMGPHLWASVLVLGDRVLRVGPCLRASVLLLGDRVLRMGPRLRASVPGTPGGPRSPRQGSVQFAAASHRGLGPLPAPRPLPWPLPRGLGPAVPLDRQPRLFGGRRNPLGPWAVLWLQGS